jgi:hypothetical protein
MALFEELRADLHALHDSIDQEAPLPEIRITTLRALTRHRFYTEEILKATGDWEPRLLKADRNRKHLAFVAARKSEFQKMAKESDGIKKIGELMRANVPTLSRDISERADNPIGQCLKQIVHSVATICLAQRENSAANLWKNEAEAFEKEAAYGAKIQNYLDAMTPEKRDAHDAFTKKFDEFLRKRTARAERGDDWVTDDEIVSSDEEFEKYLRRLLKDDAQELQLYMIVFERRLKFGESYSGFDLIHEQDMISFRNEIPDWEPDPKRDELIAKLEELTGKSFRTER